MRSALGENHIRRIYFFQRKCIKDDITLHKRCKKLSEDSQDSSNNAETP